jgi:hypothetical protein
MGEGEGERERERQRQGQRDTETERDRRNKSSKVQSTLDYVVYTHIFLNLFTVRALLAVPNVIQHNDF